MTSVSVNNVTSFHNPSSTSKNTLAKSKAVALHIQAALTAIQTLGLKVEICGSWMWIFGTNASHEFSLRAANFKWSYKIGGWYLCPATKKPNNKDTQQYSDYKPWGIGKIRRAFGSQMVQL
jgi:hypothetical protein